MDQGLRNLFAYRHAVIDEAQDLHPARWQMLRALVEPATDDLFIVGDAHQRIYGRPTPLSRYGISVVKSLTAPDDQLPYEPRDLAVDAQGG